MTKKKKKDILKKPVSNTPGEDCNCPVCVFTKSQAPGNAYDLSECPKCHSWKDDGKEAKKKS